jgi:hypothetical protein
MAVFIDGVEIPQERIAAHFVSLCSARDKVKADSGSSSVKEITDDVLRDWAEENVIEEWLFEREATRSQPIPADKHIQQELSTYPAMYEGMSPEDARAAAINALQIARAKKQIYKKLPVPTDEECKAYYDANREDFSFEGKRIIAELVLPLETVDKTRLYLSMLNLKTSIGSDYDKWQEAVVHLSVKYPDDKGLFGIISKDDNRLPKDVEEQLFALPPDGISDPIDLDDGNLYLLRNMPIKKDVAYMPFELYKEFIRGTLIREARGKAMDACYDALKAAAKITRTGAGAADKKEPQA